MGRVIDFEKGRMKYRRERSKDSMAMFENGLFEVVKVDPKEGYVEFKLERNNKTFKVLFNKMDIVKYEVGQTIKMSLKRKIFFLYWEIEYFDNIFID